MWYDNGNSSGLKSGVPTPEEWSVLRTFREKITPPAPIPTTLPRQCSYHSSNKQPYNCIYYSIDYIDFHNFYNFKFVAHCQHYSATTHQKNSFTITNLLSHFRYTSLHHHYIHTVSKSSTLQPSFHQCTAVLYFPHLCTIFIKILQQQLSTQTPFSKFGHIRTYNFFIFC